ncbi:NUDIX hydrolase [Celerinatantimonas diazotrophica]|uniref:8-oxo-dGTP diphosphatase n=1 Tax=Celerinatantimonas diazotrophica TaxID=412034 RepID=A0A4R1JLG0_9GAMM|nr:NUDIX domain-containing protein [Celerinatantimonas diazotrophica]TCK51863.1 NUDIX domain-containing protein [Celerinatantimonas diazotrophica]CAG9296444.1 hypothetical protein CEDIAZO_01595 [Celerinatantimonas diazotrophica]
MTQQVIDKLAWIALHQRRFLAVRSYGKELFYLPGGKREAGETDQQALIREIHEELSIHLEPSSLRPAGVFRAQADGKAIGVEVQLTCYWATADNQQPQASAEIEQFEWLNSDSSDQCSVAAVKVLEWLIEQDLVD